MGAASRIRFRAIAAWKREALILKTIPIVLRSPLDPIYEGLPVAIVDDWDEITPERMRAWRDQFRAQIDGPIPPQLYTRHWIERMRAHATVRS